jgi:hypothetical protein
MFGAAACFEFVEIKIIACGNVPDLRVFKSGGLGVGLPLSRNGSDE